MMRRIGRYLGNNLLGLLALIVALGGTAYAAATIGTAEIIDDSVRSVDIKNGNINGGDLLDEAVTGVDIKNGTVREADVAKTPWQPVLAPSGSANCEQPGEPPAGEFCQWTLPNRTWSNHGIGWDVARFRRNANDEVALQGMVRSGLTPDYEFPMFYLPLDLRPTASLLFPVACGDNAEGAIGAVEIQADGSVRFRGGATCVGGEWLSLSGISFAAS